MCFGLKDYGFTQKSEVKKHKETQEEEEGEGIDAGMRLFDHKASCGLNDKPGTSK